MQCRILPTTYRLWSEQQPSKSMHQLCHRNKFAHKQQWLLVARFFHMHLSLLHALSSYSESLELFIFVFLGRGKHLFLKIYFIFSSFFSFDQQFFLSDEHEIIFLCKYLFLSFKYVFGFFQIIFFFFVNIFFISNICFFGNILFLCNNFSFLQIIFYFLKKLFPCYSNTFSFFKNILFSLEIHFFFWINVSFLLKNLS